MTLKTILMSSAFGLGVLALSPLANAAGFEKTRTIVGSEKTAALTSSTAQEAAIFKTDAATLARDDRQQASGPSNSIARMVSTAAKQVDFVAMSTKAHALLTGHGKPAEAPSGGGGAGSSGGGSGSSSNPVVARVSASARALEVVAQAAKAKAAKNNGGKPSEQPGAGSSAGGGSGSRGGSANPIAAQVDPGSRAMALVATAAKAKSERANGDKPSEQPVARSSGGHSSGGSSGRAGGDFRRFVDHGSARAPSGRGSPGERATTHCNSRGMCF